MSYSYDRRRIVVAGLEADSGVREAAQAVFDSLDRGLRSDIESFLQGVVGGVAPGLERLARELYEAYAPVREVLGRKYGSTVKLYRGEPQTKPDVHRKFLSWSPSRRIAGNFAAQRGYVVLEADVRVQDVYAVLYSPHNDKYVEYLVRERKEYHEVGAPLPYLGWIEDADDGEYIGWKDYWGENAVFSRELALKQVRQIVPYVKRAGGRIVQVAFKKNAEDLDHVYVYVLLPQGEGADASSVKLGPYVVSGLSMTSRYRLD